MANFIIEEGLTVSMDIKAVIFDMGGVIYRTEDRSPREALAASYGMSYTEMSNLVFSSPSGVKAALGLITARDHWSQVCKTLNLGVDHIGELWSGFFAGDRLDLELIKYIFALRRSYKTALLSNAWDDLRSIIENEWQIAAAFDEMVISAEVGLIKPDPRIYQLAVSRLGVKPHQAVFIDDLAENVASALRFGLNGIRFANLEQMKADLTKILNGVV
jgi:epoxide hydrolase-like predicted phosphatase